MLNMIKISNNIQKTIELDLDYFFLLANYLSVKLI